MARYTSDFRSGSKKSYDEFCLLYPTIQITYKEYTDILYTYNGAMMTHVLETGDILPLPRGLGKISIQRKKTPTIFTDKKGVDHIILPINWPESRKQGKHVHYFNDHTEGWSYKWIWLKDTTTNLRMKDIWAFKPAKEHSLALTAYLLHPEKKYLYVYKEFETGRSKNKKKR